MSDPAPTKHEAAPEAVTRESVEPTVAGAPVTGKESNEVFLGGMVVMVICLILLILAGTFGYFGYRLWQSAQEERMTPSIQELGEKPKENGETTAAPAPTPTPEPAPAPTPAPAPAADLATIEVKVLNGGGARGSAGTLTDLLKKAGYAKAAFGNSVNDHTGTVIYYAEASKSAAETLKETVAKTYPAVTLSPAKAGDKDATAAAIVVILGK